MKYFFIRKDVFIKFVIICIFAFGILPIGWAFLLTLLFGCYLVLFRRAKIRFQDTLSNTPDICLSPISGKVVAIYKDKESREFEGKVSKIRILLPFWKSYGLYFPFSSQVEIVEHKAGVKIWRLAKIGDFTNIAKHYSVVLKNKLGHKVQIEIPQCKLGGETEVWIRPGDKARAAACFGYVPFGTYFDICFPNDSEILINENEKVYAGQTVLVGLKG